MLQMSHFYEPEFKKKIVRLHLEEGRTIKGLAEEYDISKASISIWTRQFRKECQTNEEVKADHDHMRENLQLKKQLAELRKENEFLKKQRHSLRRKSIKGLSIHSEISQRLWTQMAFKKV